VIGDGGWQSLDSSPTNHWVATSFNGSVAVNATVPGQIHLDLQAAGVIGDMYSGFNQERDAWVYRDSWQWTLNFTLDAALEDVSCFVIISVPVVSTESGALCIKGHEIRTAHMPS
jgi:beta-galactosidase/beta-glucuronidase